MRLLLHDEPTSVDRVILILDSNLERGFRHPSKHQSLPPNMPKAFRVEVRQNGQWRLLLHCTENTQRHRVVPVDRVVEGIRLVLEETHAAPQMRVYGFYLSQARRRVRACATFFGGGR